MFKVKCTCGSDVVIEIEDTHKPVLISELTEPEITEYQKMILNSWWNGELI